MGLDHCRIFHGMRTADRSMHDNQCLQSCKDYTGMKSPIELPLGHELFGKTNTNLAEANLSRTAVLQIRQWPSLTFGLTAKEADHMKESTLTFTIAMWT